VATDYKIILFPVKEEQEVAVLATDEELFEALQRVLERKGVDVGSAGHAAIAVVARVGRNRQKAVLIVTNFEEVVV